MESHVHSTLPALLNRALQAVDSVEGYLGLINVSSALNASIISSVVSGDNSGELENIALQMLAGKLPELKSDNLKGERQTPAILTRIDGKDNPGFAGGIAILLAIADSHALVLSLRGLRHHRSSEQIRIDLQDISELSMQALDSFLMHRWFAGQDHELEFIGMSRAFVELQARIKRIAQTHPTAPVLILGERGSGKEAIARALHYYSLRRCKPFIAVNSAALQQDLYASELFGFRKGAFTGASEDRQGKFRAAESGTLFLDEITEMPAIARAGLLRALDRGEIQSIGYDASFHVNVRVIAATNKNIERLVESGAFPADLYDRLNVLSIRVPPLRQRKEDIPLLLGYFFSRYCRLWELRGDVACAPLCGANHKIVCLRPDTLAALMAYDWPGNVRELRNTVLWLISESAGICPIPSGHLPPHILRQEASQNQPTSASSDGMKLETAIKYHIGTVLKMTHGNKSAAAKILGVPLSTLVSKIKRLGINGAFTSSKQ